MSDINPCIFSIHIDCAYSIDIVLKTDKSFKRAV